MTSEPVSGITSDDPDVARILAAMSAPRAAGPAVPPPTAPATPAPTPPVPTGWAGAPGWGKTPGWSDAPGSGDTAAWGDAPGTGDTPAWGETPGWGAPEAAPAADPLVVDADEPPLLVRGYQPPPVAAMPDQRTATATDVVTCPECGQLATVNMARRSADDFCRNCDFPLFWAKGTVITPEGQETRASLRRLPGTVGRAATAALICPHCAEPNSPTAEICVRCALSLHPVDIPEPEPEPLIVFAPPPEPEPEPEPAPKFDWWWVVAVVMAVLAVALIVVLIMLQ